MNSEFIATFRARPWTRRSQIASVLIYSFLFFLALAVGMFVALELIWDVAVRDRRRFFWLVLAAPLLISATLAWFWGRRRFTFFVRLGEDYVQVGENPGLRIPYESVEMITLLVRPGEALVAGGVSDSMIEFQGKGVRAYACIEPEDRYKCAEFLSRKCPDALFIDELGRDRLSRSVTNPKRVFTRSAAYHEKRGWGFVFGAVASAVIVGLMLHARYLRIELDVFAWWCFMGLAVLGLAGALWAAPSEFHRAKQLRAKIEALRK